MQKSGLSIATSQVGPVVVVTLVGYLDAHTIVDLERFLDQLIKAGHKKVVMDLAQLSYIASAGVGLFINLNHRLKGTGSVQLVNPSANVKEIFTILGLDAIFTLHPTVAAGVAAAEA